MNRLGKLSLILLLAMIAAGCLHRATAQAAIAEPWTLEADRITYHNDPQQITAEGEVVLRHQEEKVTTPLEIKAATATYTATGSELEARGKVMMKDELGIISAESILLNLQNQTGKLTATTIALTDQKLKFGGRLAEKTSANNYIFYDGQVTSCQTGGNSPPAWSINWKKADITIDGMAYLQQVTFQVKKVPLLYIPYMILPAKTTRQTGFLLPEISHSSRGGAGLLTPLFVNLAPSSDLTFYPGYYEKRGPFAGLEFRLVNDSRSKATLSLNYQQDRSQDQGPPGSPVSEEDYRGDGYLRTAQNRYWLRGKADQYFANSTRLHLDIDVVSDQDLLHESRDGVTGFARNNYDFISDFNRGFQEASLSARESILQLSSHGRLSSGGLEVRYVDDPLADATGTEPVQTLPRVVFSSRLPLSDLPLSVGLDSEYVHYRPEEGLGYQRLDLLPRLVMPLPLGPLVEGTVIGGFRETAYQVETPGTSGSSWNYARTQNRNTWDLSTNVAAVLARDFALGGDQTVTHTFRPNLRYNYRASGGQNELPDLDGFDRLTDTNSLTVELNNYFRSSKSGGPGLPARQLGYLKLIQAYNLKEARRELTAPDDKRRPYADLAADLEISPLSGLFLRYQTALNLYGQGVSHYNLQSRYTSHRRDNLTIDYDYVKGETSNVNIATTLHLTTALSGRYSTTRSLLDKHATSESVGLLYNAQCWGVELSSTRDSENRTLLLTFSLTGIGDTPGIRQSKI